RGRGCEGARSVRLSAGVAMTRPTRRGAEWGPSCRGGLLAASASRVLCAFAALLLASCTRLPAPGDLESLEALSRRDAEKRESKLTALEARMVLRLSGRATGKLPAVDLQARLAAPDRARLQARWLLGLLLDAAVRGDTLVAWLPGE